MLQNHNLEMVCQARSLAGAVFRVVDGGQSATLLLLPPGGLENDGRCEVSVQGLVDRWHQEEQMQMLP